MYLNVSNVAAQSAGGICDSSHDSYLHNCAGAIDGNGDVAWASSTLTNGEWWSVTFHSTMKVIRIDMQSLCKNMSQCDRWLLTFSEGTTLQVESETCMYMYMGN